jgi:hypothetical protein
MMLHKNVNHLFQPTYLQSQLYNQSFYLQINNTCYSSVIFVLDDEGVKLLLLLGLRYDDGGFKRLSASKAPSDLGIIPATALLLQKQK